ncbi:MAG: Rpn family recombination-promoting nuclease/putative transposase [Planctomycetaceae bacterium]|nr:Rpn family recombination-promoting nuclease/putative transposase [Planctomycetaceae bacterium]
MKVKPGNVFDAFTKQMFGRVVVFADFLAHYADPMFVDEIDLNKIKPAPTHYIGKDGSERIADLIFQCPLKGGGNLMAVIVFEHQSGNLKKVPNKLLKYISAIWDAETKEGKKVLSAPYFIVLRTARKPYRKAFPKMSDSLPKRRDGKPLGKLVEIEYDVVDLPAWDFHELVGGTVLRLALGILHKMTGGAEDEFPEALLPLREISDSGQKIELTQELLLFVGKALSAHNRRLEEAAVGEALKPIFQDKEKTMIKSFFEEREDIAEARGEAKGKTEGKTEAVLTCLRARFHRIPKGTEKVILQMKDPTALDSWIAHAATCQSIDEFAKALK